MTTIQRLSLADAAAVHSLRLAVDEPGPLGSSFQRAHALQPKQISSDLSAPGYASFGAFKRGQLIGAAFIAPAPLAKSWFSLFGIAVSPQSRGNGIGRTLTQACLEHAATLGAEGYLLHV